MLCIFSNECHLVKSDKGEYVGETNFWKSMKTLCHNFLS